MYYDPTQVKEDLECIAWRYGERKQLGFSTISEYEDGEIKVTSRMMHVQVYVNNDPCDMSKIEMNSPLGQWIIKKAVAYDDYLSSMMPRETTYYEDGRVVHR